MFDDCDDPTGPAQKPIPKNQVRSIGKIEQHEHEDLADARRVLLVDACGDWVTPANPLPITGNITVGANPADTPNIFNVSTILANTEYSQALPSGTKHWIIKCREADAKVKFSFTAGNSGSSYITVNIGNFYEAMNVELTGIVVYFQVSKPTRNVEIITWS